MDNDYSALASRVAAFSDVLGCVILSSDGLVLGSFPPADGDADGIKQAWLRFAAVGVPERGFVKIDDQLWAYLSSGPYAAFAVADGATRPGVLLDHLEQTLAVAGESRDNLAVARPPERVELVAGTTPKAVMSPPGSDEPAAATNGSADNGYEPYFQATTAPVEALPQTEAPIFERIKTHMIEDDGGFGGTYFVRQIPKPIDARLDRPVAEAVGTEQEPLTEDLPDPASELIPEVLDEGFDGQIAQPLDEGFDGQIAQPLDEGFDGPTVEPIEVAPLLDELLLDTSGPELDGSDSDPMDDGLEGPLPVPLDDGYEEAMPEPIELAPLLDEPLPEPIALEPEPALPEPPMPEPTMPESDDPPMQELDDLRMDEPPADPDTPDPGPPPAEEFEIDPVALAREFAGLLQEDRRGDEDNA